MLERKSTISRLKLEETKIESGLVKWPSSIGYMPNMLRHRNRHVTQLDLFLQCSATIFNCSFPLTCLHSIEAVVATFVLCTSLLEPLFSVFKKTNLDFLLSQLKSSPSLFHQGNNLRESQWESCFSRIFLLSKICYHPRRTIG